MHSLVNPQLLSVAVAISQQEVGPRSRPSCQLPKVPTTGSTLHFAALKTIKCNSSAMMLLPLLLLLLLLPRIADFLSLSDSLSCRGGWPRGWWWSGGFQSRKCLHNAKCRHARRICCH